MISRFASPGTVYTSKGMVFVVLSMRPGDIYGELIAECLLLDDNPGYIRFALAPGTVMDVESWTSTWEEAFEIASLPNSGRMGS